MTSVVRELSGSEILDSRGRPTVKARCELESGAVGAASVPAGMSKGTAEAHELRDNDPQRYRGLGCRHAVAAIEGTIESAIRGRAFEDQGELDRELLAIDGTARKERLGANTLLAVSVAFARACAAEHRLALFEHLGGLVQVEPRLPRPFVNLFSGGAHAGRQVSIQDVQIVPLAAATLDDCLASVAEIYVLAAELCGERYGMRLLRADEGGLAPPVNDSEELLTLAVEAIDRLVSGRGVDMALAVDVAATQFHIDQHYLLDGKQCDSASMIDHLVAWLDAYPIFSIEDGLAEDDWEAWPELAARTTGRVILIGDDLLCTNVDRIQRAQELGCLGALLLKPNQVGTLTEAADACRLAQQGEWQVVASARSGDTEDDWLADLAVGWGADYVKFGSITQSERLAKYNRLLEIERRFPLTFR